LSVSEKYSVYNVRSQLQQLDMICEQLFLLSYLNRRSEYDAEHDMLAIVKFIVNFCNNLVKVNSVLIIFFARKYLDILNENGSRIAHLSRHMFSLYLV